MSQDGVIRSSSFTPDAPAPSTFTNTGGVLRAQVGSDTDARALQQNAAAQRQANEQQPQWGSNARKSGEIVRTTIIDGHATETATPTVTAGNTADLRGTDPVNAGVISTARSPSGRALAGHEITATSVVMLPEGIETTAQNAARMGYIRVNPASGLYENVGGNSGPTQGPPQTEQQARATQLAKDQAELQRQMDAKREEEEKAGKDTAPEVELLDSAAEAIMSEAVAKISNLDTAAAVHSALATDGTVSEDITNRLATSLGVPPAQVVERIGTLKASFETQARNTIGTGATEVFEYARQFAPKELRQAMLDQVNTGSTKGYATLARSYMENLADTPEGREIITAANGAQENGVFVEPRTGKLFVTIPKLGRVAWKTAVREGLIKPAHRT